MDELVVQGEINSKILTLRGKQMMLDRDLAKLYQVETRRLNEQVKRNLDRFPDDFMFQLKETEYQNLKSQFATSSSKHGGIRKMPYAFTEEGIYMLATVLNSTVAVQTNIAIIRTFKKLREFSKHYNALAKQLIEVDRKYEKRNEDKLLCLHSFGTETVEAKRSRVGETYNLLKKALDELIASSELADSKVMGFLK